MKTGILGKGAGKLSKILPPNVLNAQLSSTLERFGSNLHKTHNQLKEIALFNRLTLQKNSVDTIESSAPIAELDKVVPEVNMIRADQLTDLIVQKPQQKEGVNRNQKQKDSLPPILNLITPRIEQKSRFTVKVNGQVFIGFNSVNLSKRMLCIDGKLVAQSKIAVVSGQPSAISADGSVTHGNNQSVLMSK